MTVKVVEGERAKRTERKKERDREMDRSEEMDGVRTPTQIETTAANVARTNGTISEIFNPVSNAGMHKNRVKGVTVKAKAMPASVRCGGVEDIMKRAEEGGRRGEG